MLAGYDALFLKDSAVVERYRRLLGLNAHFLPEACNPRWHRPIGAVTGPTDRPVVLVAGNVYATRFVLLRALAAAGVELAIYGPGWAEWLPPDERLSAAYTHRYLAREEKASAFRGAAVVLNSLASHEADGLNCRLFEAAACGAIVLTERRPRLEEFFEVPEEVSACSSFDELLDGVRRLASLEAEERARIGDAASERAHAERAYANRFEAMCAILGAG